MHTIDWKLPPFWRTGALAHARQWVSTWPVPKRKLWHWVMGFFGKHFRCVVTVQYSSISCITSLGDFQNFVPGFFQICSHALWPSITFALPHFAVKIVSHNMIRFCVMWIFLANPWSWGWFVDCYILYYFYIIKSWCVC